MVYGLKQERRNRMDEVMNQEIIPTEAVSYDGLLGKWFHFLFPVQVASVIILVISGLQIAPITVSLISYAVSICVIVALFHMAPADKHYKTSAILHCVTVAGGLLITFTSSNLFTFAVSICSIISSYQEYKGHSMVVAVKDGKLSQKWMNLFGWSLAVGILTGLLSLAGTVIGVFVGISVQTLISIILICTTVLSACVQVFYLIYLKRMQAYFPK